MTSPDSLSTPMTVDDIAARVKVLFSRPGAKTFFRNLIEDYINEYERWRVEERARQNEIDLAVLCAASHPRAQIRRHEGGKGEERLLRKGFRWEDVLDQDRRMLMAWVRPPPEVMPLVHRYGATWLSEDCAWLAAAHDAPLDEKLGIDDPTRARALDLPEGSSTEAGLTELLRDHKIAFIIREIRQDQKHPETHAALKGRLTACYNRVESALRILPDDPSRQSGRTIDPRRLASMATIRRDPVVFAGAHFAVRSGDPIEAARILLLATVARCRAVESEIDGGARIVRWDHFQFVANYARGAVRDVASLCEVSGERRRIDDALSRLEQLCRIDGAEDRAARGVTAVRDRPPWWTDALQALRAAEAVLGGLPIMTEEQTAASFARGAADRLEKFAAGVGRWFPTVEGEWSYSTPAPPFQPSIGADSHAEEVYQAILDIDRALKALRLRDAAGEPLGWESSYLYTEWMSPQPEIAPVESMELLGIGRSLLRWREARRNRAGDQQRYSVPANSASWARGIAAELREIARRLLLPQTYSNLDQTQPGVKPPSAREEISELAAGSTPAWIRETDVAAAREVANQYRAAELVWRARQPPGTKTKLPTDKAMYEEWQQLSAHERIGKEYTLHRWIVLCGIARRPEHGFLPAKRPRGRKK